MNGKLLAQGLLNAKGDELRLVYALIVETKMLDMLVARVKDTFQKETNHFEEDLQRIIDGLADVPDEQLQVELFLHMLRLLKIKGAHYNILAEIEYACGQIVDEAYTLLQKQQKDFKQYTENRTEEKAVQLVMYQMHKVFESFDASMEDMSDAEQQAFVQNIEQFIKTLPVEKQRELKEKLNIDELTTQTIRQLIVSQGSVLVLTVIVEVAGFAAFTTLTSTIAAIAGIFGATLPFGFYIFATSTLSVITGPLAIAAAVVGGGALIKMQNDKVKKMFVPIGVVQLLLPVVLEGEKVVDAQPFTAHWLRAYDEQTALLQQIARLNDELAAATNSYDEKKAAIKEQLALQKQWQERIRNEYLAVQQQLPTLVPATFLGEAQTLHQQITALHRQIEQHEQDKLVKKLETGFFTKLKNSMSSVATDFDIRSLKKSIADKEQLLAHALVKQQHRGILQYVEEIEQLEQKISTSITHTAQLQKERDAFEKVMTAKKSAIKQAKENLSRLQKEVYGLQHIE